MTTVTEAHLRSMLYDVQAELARRRLIDFCAWTKEDWITARHHEYLCDLADQVVAGKITRLLISLPPRHTKSEIFSIRLPALYLGKYPERQVIHASYAAALSNDFSRQVRGLLRDDRRYRQLFHARLDPDRQRVDDWKTAAGGGMFSVGVGGGVTGHGADLLVIDDPTKEGDEHSPVVLESIVTWFLSAARTRLSPGGAIVIPMTRWHPNDLIGVLIDLAKNDPDADQWVVVNIPALIETQEQAEQDVLGREIGDALWPERFSVRDILAVKSLSKRYFASLYQQDPQPDVVQLFREQDFRRFQRSERRWLIEQQGAWCIDLAASESEVADYTVVARYVYEDGCLRASHILRRQLSWTKVLRLLRRLIKLFDRDVFVFPKQFLEMLALQDLRRIAPARIRQVEFPGQKDKRARALVAAERAESGRYYVEDSQIGDLFIREHDRFPDKHDDCVDVSSVAVHYFGLHQEVSVFVGSADPQYQEALRDRELQHLAAVGRR